MDKTSIAILYATILVLGGYQAYLNVSMAKAVDMANLKADMLMEWALRQDKQSTVRFE